MGTIVSFHVEPGGCPATVARAAVAAACTRLHQLDDLFSTWKPGSPINRFRAGLLPAQKLRPRSLSSSKCATRRERSRGWFNPWAMPGGFDPTGLVKGWAAEEALAVLANVGVKAAMVNAGGDIAVLGVPNGSQSWRIGIRHPWRPEALACVLEVDVAVATSGCYERGPHLINPKDGRMLFQTASATVVGPSLPLCDALATALVVADDNGPGLARSLEGYEAYIIRADGSEDATEGIVFATEGVK